METSSGSITEGELVKIIDSHMLRGLPNEVKDLVRDGVYSLYTLKSSAGPKYLLVTNSAEHYFLAADGTLVPGVKVDDLRAVIDQVVSFSDATTDRVMVNCA
jgi:hypothetical protein